ncbi:MAG TPA: WD40 repeat domain-containing protein [Gemmataceae bacterium]|nr:WD40 repeat domain-containing protein [Gemmataceae bacterium]
MQISPMAIRDIRAIRGWFSFAANHCLYLRGIAVAMAWVAVTCGGAVFANNEANVSPRPKSQIASAQPPFQGKPRFDLLGDLLPPGAIARLGTPRVWKDNYVRGFALSPDGKTVATTNDDVIRLWDFATGKMLAELKDNVRSVSAIAFSKDGRGLVSVAGREPARLWNVASGELLWIFDEVKKKGKVKDGVDPGDPGVFSPDGTLLTRVARDGTVRLIELATNRRLVTLGGHSLMNTRVVIRFSPDGKLLATTDKTLRVWNVRTGKLLQVYQPPSVAVVSVAFSPDGRMVAVGCSDGVVRILEANTGRERLVFRGHLAIYDDPEYEHRSMPVAFSPDGKTVASGSRPGIVMLWDAASGDVLQLFVGTGERIGQLAFSPDGKTLVAGGDGSRLSFWAVPRGRQNGNPSVQQEGVRTLAFAPNGKTVAAGGVDGNVRLWDAATGKVLQLFEGHTRQVKAVNLSADGKTLASAGFDNTVRLWDTASGKQRLSWTTKQYVPSVTISPDGKTLATVGPDALRLWDASTGKELRSAPSDAKGFRFVAFSPDGKMLATSSGVDERTFQLWSVATFKQIHRWPVKTTTLDWLAFSPDGETLMAADKDCAIRRWDIATGKELPILANMAGKGVGMALSPDGKTLATTGQALQLWDMDTGKLLRTYSGHSSLILSAAFSPDGKRLATSSLDSSILVWDVSP